MFSFSRLKQMCLVFASVCVVLIFFFHLQLEFLSLRERERVIFPVRKSMSHDSKETCERRKQKCSSLKMCMSLGCEREGQMFCRITIHSIWMPLASVSLTLDGLFIECEEERKFCPL